MSAASTIVNKRKRVDEDADMGAEGTQFKVYQGLLAMQSAIFGDMFAIPPPSTGQDQVEGCPLVHLSDTSADLAFVLEAIFLRKWVATGEPMPIEVVAAFLRLGNKYEIEALRAEAPKRLLFEFPSERAILDEHIYPVDRRGTMIELADWTFINVTNLAREQNLLSVLPLALYSCCRMWNAPDLEQGQRRADNSLATLSPVNEHACFRAYCQRLCWCL
ncbi:hypothetical protein FIBSPDRAFT_952058 [Athelia psychrophila]|uniref:BTB domain-containing protein n=1 Tax=Athelia psychrophila TaxID=1759441 RepID=A0A166M1S1_9AGAM|nr:hypothetical protein FIBSPDRAFT_952058 [Fibularhizoctonia sp. CBS 109695]